MSRTFRHNSAASAALSPSTCEICHASAPEIELHLWLDVWQEHVVELCRECCSEWVPQLRASGVKHQVLVDVLPGGTDGSSTS